MLELTTKFLVSVALKIELGVAIAYKAREVPNPSIKVGISAQPYSLFFIGMYYFND